ncbi:semaphorin-7A-like isoform X1 [Anguilla anguilla]|uniref:semaphorin-7A-like isoform X1 n=2 Tax=Anguilla anguilla TaxID=7936 RepID=UPI0015B06CB2|nr:semaphorin-7A-like isoform X1 [Anguilla anguilla]
MLLSIWILYAVFSTLNIANASEYHHNPRIILTPKDMTFRRHSRNGTHDRTEIVQGPHNDSIYVGGHGTLSYIDFQNPSQSKEVTLFENECKDQNSTDSCEHDITILHTFKGRTDIFVCGTNGILPVCCYMKQSEFGTCSSFPAEGIAPFSVKEKAPSLYIEEELFTTANLDARGDGVGIRRHFGTNGKLSAPASKTEQRFVAMEISGPRADPLQDRIYAFLAQRNRDKHPDADRWVSQVVQVCKVDRGGTKNILERLWTSLLSARLYCGIHFSKILDVDVLHAANWRDSKVYALFTNVWGMRAVCVYTLGTIDDVFMNSKFKNSGGPSPNSRNRTCVENSQTLPREVLRQRKDYQELKDWIRPVNDKSPFMVSHRHYRHIRADTVIGRGGVQHTVLFLSLDSGKVHKVLEQAGPTFVIAELQPFGNRTHIQNMLLQSSTKKMYVSSSTEVVELDLHSCMEYGQRCEECVQARDPYCGWDGTKCTAASSDTVQDVEHGNYTVCEEAGKTDKYVAPRKVDNLPPSARYVLQCPTLSGHAQYSWHHHGKTTECTRAEGQCLLLIENMSPAMEGTYSCVSSERGYERTLVEYELRIESIATTSNQDPVLQPATYNVNLMSSRKELDLHSCMKYGQRCEDCVQARDLNCTWDGTICTAASSDTVQDVEHGNYMVCEETGKTERSISSRKFYNVPPLAKHVLLCPTVSGHANYSWHHHGRTTACLQAEGQCLLLIENMSPAMVGNYSCVSSEGGYVRTLVEYELLMESRAPGLDSSLLASVVVLICLILLH